MLSQKDVEQTFAAAARSAPSGDAATTARDETEAARGEAGVARDRTGAARDEAGPARGRAAIAPSAAAIAAGGATTAVSRAASTATVGGLIAGLGARIRAAIAVTPRMVVAALALVIGGGAWGQEASPTDCEPSRGEAGGGESVSLIRAGSAALTAGAMAWAANGYVWPGSKPRVPFYISTNWIGSGQPDDGLGLGYPNDGTFDDIVAAFQAAAAEWNTHGNSNFKYVYMGTTQNASVTNDGANVVAGIQAKSSTGQMQLAGARTG